MNHRFSLLALAAVTALLSLPAAHAKARKTPVIKQCTAVVAACQKAGFVAGKRNKHPGIGMWSGCVRPISRGRKVAGVTGVSKQAAVSCLKARKTGL